MHRIPVDISRIEASKLSFEQGEVLDGQDSIKKRSANIHRATHLGNLKHQKVNILFNTGTEVYKVHTTIWLHYNDEIYLKGNIKVPLERIIAVNF